MKKTLLIASVVALTAISSFGQGQFLFSAGSKGVWDGFTVSGVSKLGATINVALLWGSSSQTPLVDSIAASTPTNSTSASSVVTSANVQTVWTSILSDPNFQLAQNSSTSTTVQQGTAANGGFSYNSANSFGVTGTTGGTAYNVFVIGWSSAYATAAAAQAAGSPVGWSSVFSYTPSTAPNPAPTFVTPNFGVSEASVVVAPEPATLALAGLGGASLLMFRRKK